MSRRRIKVSRTPPFVQRIRELEAAYRVGYAQGQGDVYPEAFLDGEKQGRLEVFAQLDPICKDLKRRLEDAIEDNIRLRSRLRGKGHEDIRVGREWWVRDKE